MFLFQVPVLTTNSFVILSTLIYLIFLIKWIGAIIFVLLFLFILLSNHVMNKSTVKRIGVLSLAS